MIRRRRLRGVYARLLEDDHHYLTTTRLCVAAQRVVQSWQRQYRKVVVKVIEDDSR